MGKHPGTLGDQTRNAAAANGPELRVLFGASYLLVRLKYAERSTHGDTRESIIVHSYSTHNPFCPLPLSSEPKMNGGEGCEYVLI